MLELHQHHVASKHTWQGWETQELNTFETHVIPAESNDSNDDNTLKEDNDI